MRMWQFLAPVVGLAPTGSHGCKAVKLQLEDEIRTLRAMQAREDTARRSQVDSAVMMLARTNDSLRALSQRLGSFQANVGGELFEMGKQLITIQELAGMSSRRITELRSAFEERAQSMTPDSTPQQPGPAQLFTLSFEQLRNRSYATARAGFDELLRRYPEFEEASKAQLYVAQSYADENKVAEADSAYSLVVRQYPRSPDAATALYKYALSQLSQGKTAAARTALQRVVRDFPTSTEAELANDRLRTMPRR